MSGLVPYGRSNPCPQCRHSDGWCWASADGRFTCCRRVQGEHAKIREDKRGNEYYVTRNGPGDAGEPPEPPIAQWRETLADADTRDRTYRALLDALSLSAEHLRHLRQRGLPGESIERTGYRTLPVSDGERARAVRHVMQAAGCVYLLNVPGFFKRDGSKETRLAGTPGILIPIRDEQGLIVAFLIRPDSLRDGGGKYRWLSAPPDAIGSGPGSLVHVSIHESTSSVIRVTEGALKADIATALSGIRTIGIPGVAAWKQALPTLARLQPSKVLVAFDVDARSKPQVAGPLSRLAEALQQGGHDVAIEVWPEKAGKGIDDVLVSGRQASIRVVAGDQVAEELAQIEQSAGVPAPTVPPASNEERKSQAQLLLELANDVSFFHTPDGRLFADIRVNGQRETWSITSTYFQHWLAHRMYRVHGRPPSSQSMNDALGVFSARARFDGPEREVHLRIAEAEGRIYVDLVDDTWSAIEIVPTGWRIVREPPVRFRRTPGMRPLPFPVVGGQLESLREFLNLEGVEDWYLAIAWLLGALRARGPYPLAVLQGEQGAAKSTTARILRELIDPNTSPLRARPRDVQELMIAANNGFVICYDNLSGLSSELSDALCRLATGGGFSTRELYTNTEEVLFEAQRPVILAGIDAIATRADLADRALVLTLPPISDRKRRPEEDFWAAFHEARPKIFGALLTVAAGALGHSGSTPVAALPRMADFAKWIAAAEPALGWRRGTFLAAYRRNRGEAAASTIDADPVSIAAQKLVHHEGAWDGSASELLARLADWAGDRVVHGRSWPKTANLLSNRLRRAAPALRAWGIEVDFGRTKLARTIGLRPVPSAEAGDAETSGDGANSDSVTHKVAESRANDDGDARDGPSTPVNEEPEPARNPTPEDQVNHVLQHPLVNEAIGLFDPADIQVRLADKSTWAVHDGRIERNDDPAAKAASEPQRKEGENHDRKSPSNGVQS
jgi:hypothetical protein